MSCMEPALKRKKMNTTEKDLEGSPIQTNLPSSQELKNLFDSPDPFVDSSPETNNPPGSEARTMMSDLQYEESDELQEVISTVAKTDSVQIDRNVGESSSAHQEDIIPWKGCSLSEFQKGQNGYGMPQLPAIKPSSTHTVMFQVGPNKNKANTPTDAWDNDHVRLPCSPQNKYPVGDSVKPRWDMVKAALQKPIRNSEELEAAIMSYNNKYVDRWDFSGLHFFFNEAIEEEEMQCFFSELLPQIIELALQLPALITQPLPLLRKHKSHNISLTQQQVACLLANAFFCTFPRRNAARKASEYATFPDINFNRLFQSQKRKSYVTRASEKLKCIFHYFRRVCVNPPKGTITFSRRHIPPSNLPKWESSGHFFRKLHVSSHGTIEECGKGMLQIDFANKMVGGGVLGFGCVQEEIRFVICPELIIARLFTECLDATEAVIVTGCEQYSIYEGYADNFTWSGDYQDVTPRDSCGRMLCTVVAIDALFLRYPAQQFIVTNLLREINKAYAGFYNVEINPEHLSAVATGNWGCGVYRGNTRLKALLQLMAATQTSRGMAYFTFGDSQLCDDIAQMHAFLVDHKATVGLVWRHLSRYYDQCYRSGIFSIDLYDYLCKSIDPTFSRNSSTKGRCSVSQSPSKMKTAHSHDKSNQSEPSSSKGNENKSENLSFAASLEKVTTTTTTSKAHLVTDCIASTTESTHQGDVSGKSKIPFTTFISTPTVGSRESQRSSKMDCERGVTSLHPQGILQKVKHSVPSTARSVNTIRSRSPTRKISPTKDPVKNAHPQLKDNNAAFDVGDEGLYACLDVQGTWPEESRRSHNSTIQKRISDYFYEINIPK